MVELKIGGKIINEYSEAFVVAECGHNHQGDIHKAIKMVEKAKEVGCDAVKFQKRNNKKLYTKTLYNSPYDNENSFGPTYGYHREALEFGMDEYREIKNYADELGIILFATPFDEDSADFLEILNIPCYKTASGDLTNIPLLQHIARFKKPMLVSTGGAVLGDVMRARDSILEINQDICLMQCTAAYPVLNFEELNLNVIKSYKEKFNCVVGLSAHDAGIAMAVAAYVLGARVIEKHFTLSRVLKGTDHAFSLEPKGMERMIRDLRRTRQALGDGVKRIYPSENKPIYKMGKGCYAAQDIPAGTRIKKEMIIFKSPKAEFAPYQINKIEGRVLAWNLAKDDPFQNSCFEEYKK